MLQIACNPEVCGGGDHTIGGGLDRQGTDPYIYILYIYITYILHIYIYITYIYILYIYICCIYIYIVYIYIVYIYIYIFDINKIAWFMG